jgi:hypothetical protein
MAVAHRPDGLNIAKIQKTITGQCDGATALEPEA